MFKFVKLIPAYVVGFYFFSFGVCFRNLVGVKKNKQQSVCQQFFDAIVTIY